MTHASDSEPSQISAAEHSGARFIRLVWIKSETYLASDEHKRPPGELGHHPVQSATHREYGEVAAEEEEHQDTLPSDLSSL